jgi:transcriptional regulator with XRE-family HTH domain
LRYGKGQHRSTPSQLESVLSPPTHSDGTIHIFKILKRNEKMLTKSEIQDAFVNGVRREFASLGLGWGGQTRLAKMAGISSSYLCDLLNKRKVGSEEVRRKIAAALGVTYEELTVGGNRDGREEIEAEILECLKYGRFTEDRAICIYQFAAREVGIHDSHFFTDESLRKTKPPGWAEFLSRKISDLELYDRAQKEIEKLRQASPDDQFK